MPILIFYQFANFGNQSLIFQKLYPLGNLNIRNAMKHVIKTKFAYVFFQKRLASLCLASFKLRNKEKCVFFGNFQWLICRPKTSAAEAEDQLLKSFGIGQYVQLRSFSAVRRPQKFVPSSANNLTLLNMYCQKKARRWTKFFVAFSCRISEL